MIANPGIIVGPGIRDAVILAGPAESMVMMAGCHGAVLPVTIPVSLPSQVLIFAGRTGQSP
jgi:hypothetical protein